MFGLDGSMTDGDIAAGERCGFKEVQREGCHRDVQNRVKGTHFMKVHLVEGTVVDRSFRSCENFEDGKGPVDGVLGEG